MTTAGQMDSTRRPAAPAHMLGTAPPMRRRGALAVLAAALPGAALAGAANPDAELLAQCAEFAALVGRYATVCRAATTIAQEDAAAPVLDGILSRQAALVSAMRPASTRPGMRAKARCLALYAPEFADGTFEGGGMVADLLASVMRDAIAGGAA